MNKAACTHRHAYIPPGTTTYTEHATYTEVIHHNETLVFWTPPYAGNTHSNSDITNYTSTRRNKSKL